MLKNCPFCEGKAFIEDQHSIEKFGDCRITCEDCYARSDVFFKEPDETEENMIYEAIRAWNNRPQSLVTPLIMSQIKTYKNKIRSENMSDEMLSEYRFAISALSHFLNNYSSKLELTKGEVK